MPDVVTTLLEEQLQAPCLSKELRVHQHDARKLLSCMKSWRVIVVGDMLDNVCIDDKFEELRGSRPCFPHGELGHHEKYLIAEAAHYSAPDEETSLGTAADGSRQCQTGADLQTSYHHQTDSKQSNPMI